MNDKEKLNKAIEFLEIAYFGVNNGCSYDSISGLKIIPDTALQYKIGTFVKSVKNTKLKVPKNDYTLNPSLC